MRVLASFCRQQEALQRALATSEPLENRRKIALTAAKAWESEALLAEMQTSKPGQTNQPPIPRARRSPPSIRRDLIGQR